MLVAQKYQTEGRIQIADKKYKSWVLNAKEDKEEQQEEEQQEEEQEEKVWTRQGG